MSHPQKMIAQLDMKDSASSPIRSAAQRLCDTYNDFISGVTRAFVPDEVSGKDPTEESGTETVVGDSDGESVDLGTTERTIVDDDNDTPSDVKGRAAAAEYDNDGENLGKKVEPKDKNKEPSTLDEWTEEFFEREYRDHPWSAGAHDVVTFGPSMAEIEEYRRLEMTGEAYRRLEPGEEILSDADVAEEIEQREGLCEETYQQWSDRTRNDSKAVARMHFEELQLHMDLDKEFWNGEAEPEPRQKSILKKPGIVTNVERGKRVAWADEMSRRYPGRYVPYPGRAARSPPSSLSAAEKARQQYRKT